MSRAAIGWSGVNDRPFCVARFILWAETALSWAGIRPSGCDCFFVLFCFFAFFVQSADYFEIRPYKLMKVTLNHILVSQKLRIKKTCVRNKYIDSLEGKSIARCITWCMQVDINLKKVRYTCFLINFFATACLQTKHFSERYKLSI